MAVTPTGCLSLTLSRVRTMLSECATFRTWVGAANPTAALAFIHIAASTSSATRQAVVDLTDDFNKEQIAGGGATYLVTSGSTVIKFMSTATPSATYEDNAYEFYNFLGGVWEELAAQSGTSGNVNIRAMTITEKPWRSQEDDGDTDGDYWYASILLNWGI